MMTGLPQDSAAAGAPEATDRAQGVRVSVTGLVKRFGAGRAEIMALGGVDVDIGAGEAVAVMGPSGSGKSTLLHLIGAMDTPTAGSVRVGGVGVERLRGAEAARYRRTVGFVFQGFHLLGALSALDNVLAPLIPLRHAGDHEAGAADLLERVGLGSRLGALPSQLSGGEQQRVAIARALVGRPSLILADEPTGNLDSATGEGIVGLLLSLRAERNTTLVLATHEHAVAGRCDRIVRLADGKVVT